MNAENKTIKNLYAIRYIVLRFDIASEEEKNWTSFQKKKLDAIPNFAMFLDHQPMR